MSNKTRSSSTSRLSTKDESETLEIKVPEKIELNVLLKFIKPFDGSREKLNSFISNCQNAYNLADISQKPIIFRYILSQLEGKAQSTCDIREFESFDQFIQFIRNQFGEKKHYSHLLSELQECKQNPSESVSQFALNIETLLSKLITEINISNPTKRKTDLSGRIATIQDIATHTFIMGLHPRISQMVRCRNPESLNSALNFAIAEEKIMSSMTRRFPQVTDRPRTQPRREFNTLPPRFQTNPRPQHNQFRRPVNTSELICRYCKNIGHSIETCRKRQYNNNLLNNSNNTNRFRQNPRDPQTGTTSRSTPGPSRAVFTADRAHREEPVADDESEYLNE